MSNPKGDNMKKQLLALFFAMLLMLSAGCAIVVEDSDPVVVEASANN